MTVLRTSDDTVNIGAGWTLTSVEIVGSSSFDIFTQGAATLRVLSPDAVSVFGLDGQTGFRIDGIDDSDDSATSVSGIGDFNGDGFDDLIIGAPDADPVGANPLGGESYVVFGRSGGFTSVLNLSALDGTNGFRLDGVDSSDRSGYSVSGAGDLNGDGLADLIVGARFANGGGASNSGESYVVFGQSGAMSSALDLSSLNGTTGFRLDGIDASDVSGHAVSSAGDVNGDGFADVIVGARSANPGGVGGAGESYVVFGTSSGFASAISLGSLNGTDGFRLDGTNSYDYSGQSVASAGDVNADGFGDLIIGASGTTPTGQAGSGYIVFGQSTFPAAIDLGSLNGVSGFRLDGIDANDRAGFSVSSAGDINADGFSDVVIGAFQANTPTATSGGESYVVFGQSGGFASTLDLATLNGTTGFRLDGILMNDRSGYAVGGGGDINGDGFDDVLVAAPRGDSPSVPDVGLVYVLYGKSGAFASAISLDDVTNGEGFQIQGDMFRGYAGESVSFGGDINGDGFGDVIIGSPDAGPNGVTDAGSTVVFFGGNFTGGAETQVGDDADNTLTATEGAAAVDILIGGGGDDVLISDGGADVLRGGQGDDTLAFPDADFSTTRLAAGGPGTDTLRLDGAGVTLDLTAIADNRIVDIEEIDITGSGNNSLTVSFREVINLSSHSNELNVRRDLGDDVEIGDGWTRIANEVIDSALFEVFTQGAATLRVQKPTTVDVTTLDGNNGFRLDGIDSFDFSGRSVSNAGDVNGDGIDDFIIGATSGDPGGENNAGEIYLIFGRTGGFVSAVDLAALDGTTGFRLDGIDESDFVGRRVAGGGDVNADGLADLIIGSDQADAGESYVIFGRTAGFGSAFDLGALDGTNGLRLDGIDASDSAGFVGDAGDLNSDGFSDIVIGAPSADSGDGESYVVFGMSGGFASAIDLGALNGATGFRLNGFGISAANGFSVNSAGDINGDGFGDLVVGEPDQSEVFVIFGASGGFASAFTPQLTLDGTNGFRLDGDLGEFAGYSVSSAGDVNGDGFGDLIVGATPESYVVFGKSGGFTSALDLTALNGTTGFRVEGVPAQGFSGRSVSGSGDLNGDGFDDLLVGAPFAGTGGEVYVVFGASGGFASAISVAQLSGGVGLRVNGAAAGDEFGYAVSNAEDVNGDGFDDLVIGATNADPGGELNAGESYVIFGGNFTGGLETQIGDETDNALTATEGAGAVDILIGGFGDDELISDGGADVLRGGAGDDTLTIIDVDFSSTRRLVGGNGTDTLRLDAPGATLDLTAIPDNRIVDVEAIDLLGNDSETLTLDVREVLNLSTHSNTLSVIADTLDVVNIGAGWTLQSTDLDGVSTIEVFTQGAATLRVQTFGVVDVRQLDGTNGFSIDGDTFPDGFGFSVSNAGDVNGDGFDDFIVGAPRGDAPNPNYSGDAYVIFGSSGGFNSSLDLDGLDGMNGFRLTGDESGDQAGYAVSGGGDVNGDGFADVVVGTRYAPVGVAYVVFGKSAGFTSSLDLASLNGTSGFQLHGDGTYDYLGASLSITGDINGDGFDDLIAGAHNTGFSSIGAAYVVFGRSGGFASSIDAGTLNGTDGFLMFGVDANDGAGFRVSVAGDINADGVDDLIVTAPGGDVGDTNTGETYIVFGQTGGFASSIALGGLDGASGFRVDGIDAGDTSGLSASGAGDFNGDGFDDLIIGAPRGDDGVNINIGESYVLFGRSGGFASAFDPASLDGTNGFRIDGSDASDESGRAVAAAGDANGDGFDDLLIGADSNEAVLIFGQSGGFQAVLDFSELNGINGIRFERSFPNTDFGESVGGGGDINGDGFDDLLFGSALSSTGTTAGETSVFFGGNFTDTAGQQIGTDGDDTLEGVLTDPLGTTGTDILIGGRGNDLLESDGGPDVLIGGQGDDILAIPDAFFNTTRRLDGGTGIDTLRLDAAGDRFGPGIGDLDLTAIPDNRIVDIEIIDITGRADNTLTLDFQEVVNLSSHSNTVTVFRNLEDTVNIGPGWTQQADQQVGDDLFEVFTQDAATLNIEIPDSIQTNQIAPPIGFQLDGSNAGDDAGRSVSNAGDVNGDGFDDVIVGAYNASRGGIISAGETYVVFGKSGGFARQDLDQLDGTDGFRLNGISSLDESGLDVSGGGDLNGDGLADLVIGARLADPGGFDRGGETYVVFGRNTGFTPVIALDSLDGTTGFRLDGIDIQDESGVSVSVAGDINGD